MASETTQRRKRRLAKLATEPEQASSSKSARTIGTPDETELVKSLTKNSDDDLGLEKGGNIFRNHLLDLWAKNKQSAKTIHEIADLSQNAGARGVQKIAKVGASGKHPQNMARDLLRMALVNCTLPPLYWALSVLERYHFNLRRYLVAVPLASRTHLCAHIQWLDWNGDACQCLHGCDEELAR